MRILGVNALNHDASLAVIEDGKILWAAQAERYSKIKNDGNLNQAIVDEALSYGKPDVIAYYERPLLKKFRQFQAGQWDEVFTKQNLPSVYLKQFNLDAPIKYVGHHHSHAAAGYFTSKFDEACILVIDAIGEVETTTIWKAKGNKLKKIFVNDYPNSIGLFYSAMTQRVGLKPNEEEYILMGMAAYGNSNRLFDEMLHDFVYFPSWDVARTIEIKKNLHRGCRDWRPDLTTEQDMYDIAAAAQAVYEMLLENLLGDAAAFTGSKNLVFMGGCALNCSANRLLGKYFDNIWIMPNPGDAGSALGAAAVVYGKKIEWTDAYLGYNIPGNYPVSAVLDTLLTDGIVGVASGRAEFGPRALGNRSLLADPRDPNIKDKVNEIKRRQKFRPFAPVILAELADQYFDSYRGWTSSPYMQSIACARDISYVPGVVHVDGTSRVQTVAKDSKAGIRKVLEAWYALTGCPMLLNTSLNIKGEPMVNDRADADRFERLYNVKVCS